MRRPGRSRRSATRCAASSIDAETVRVLARRGRTLIVANKLGIVQAAAGVDGSNVARRRARPAARRPRRQRRPRCAPACAERLGVDVARRRHRHDGPRLAHRADRRRDRRGGPRRCCTATRGTVDGARQRAARHRDRGRRRARRAPPTWSRASSAGSRSRWCAACTRSTTAPPPATSCARSTRTCSGSAPRRRSRWAAARPCCCAGRCARSPTSRSTSPRSRRAVGVALTAPAPHHTTPVRFVLVPRAPHRAAGRHGRPLARATSRPTARPADEVERRMRRGDLLRRAPELVIPFRTGDGMHTYPDDARRRPSTRCSPSRAGPRCSRCWSRWPPRASGRAGSARRSSPPTSCARVLDLPADWQPLGAIAVGVPARAVAAARPARPDGLLEW